MMEAAIPSLEPFVKLASIPGRCRALVASRCIKPGEILLSESPLLLYPASSSPGSPLPFCFHCFRSIRSASFPCPSCPSASFCSTRCLSAALSSSHSPSLCRVLAALPPLLDPDLRTQIHFLLAAFSLSSSSPRDFHRLLSLDGGDATTGSAETITLHSFLSPLTNFPLEVTAALIAKDKRNAFGLMEPFREEDAGDRKVRAYGIYPNASFFNHDCLPNACRFDYLDWDREGNTNITVRAIHDIPEGREVCLSYFPVNWGYKERQHRLMEVYGFQCNCDRCEVEKNWKDDEDEVGRMEEEDEETEYIGQGGGEVAGDGTDDFPHAYFFMRFVCEREYCGGTLAAMPPSPQGTVSHLMECNFCGQIRNDEGSGEVGVMLHD